MNDQADELKMKWHAIDREAVEKIKTLLDRGIKVNAKDEVRVYSDKAL